MPGAGMATVSSVLNRKSRCTSDQDEGQDCMKVACDNAVECVGCGCNPRGPDLACKSVLEL